MYMDLITKLNFVKNLLMLRKLKFDWDVTFPALFRAYMLKARWRIANNRQQVYSLHSEIIAEKEAEAQPEADQEDQEEDMPQDQVMPETATDDDNDLSEQGKASQSTSQSNNQAHESSRNEQSKGPQAYDISMKKGDADSLSLEAHPSRRLNGIHKHNSRIEAVNNEEGTSNQPLVRNTPVFLQTQTGAPNPNFVLWGTSQVMEGSRIMGIDEQSFDPSTSGVGPPPEFPELPDNTETAITCLKVVAKNAGAAFQAYLDYGQAPLVAIAKISWQQGFATWVLGSVVVRLKFMLASVRAMECDTNLSILF